MEDFGLSLPMLEEVDFEEKWELTRSSLVELLGVKDLSRGWMDVNYDIYLLGSSDSMRLYNELKRFVVSYCEEVRERIQGKGAADIFESYVTEWEMFDTALHAVCKTFSQLSGTLRFEIILEKKRTQKDPNLHRKVDYKYKKDKYYYIHELFLLTFRERVYYPIQDSLNAKLFKLFEKARKDEPYNERFLKIFIDGLRYDSESPEHVEEYGEDYNYGVYNLEFEAKYLEKTKQHVKATADRVQTELSVIDYIRLCDKIIKFELDLARRFTTPHTQSNIKRLLFLNMVEKRSSEITKETKKMMGKEMYNELEIEYKLLSMEKDMRYLKEMGNVFENYVAADVRKVYDVVKSGSEKEFMFFDHLVEDIKKYKDIISKLLGGNYIFFNALDKALARAREKIDNFPENLAKFCHFTLRHYKLQKMESEIDQKLTQIRYLFNYVADEDVFEKFYIKYFSQRLIKREYISLDLEMSMITHLKEASGYSFVSKLMRMVTDITMSIEMQDEYRSLVSDSSELNKVSFFPIVLTTATWPITNARGFKVPDQLNPCLTRYLNFYRGKHHGRKLNWIHSLSTANLRAHLRRNYEIIVSGEQMVVLLLFNDAKTLSLPFIEEQTGLPSKEIRRVMKTLVESKLVKKEVDSSSESTNFTLNEKFSSKRVKINISQRVFQETQEDKSLTHKKILDERQMTTESIIIRIMKSKQRMDHTSLVNEVIEHLSKRFKPSVAIIKKAVGSLIERNYIGRDADNLSRYRYVISPKLLL